MTGPNDNQDAIHALVRVHDLEREKLGRRLHQGIGQQLTAAAFQHELLMNELADGAQSDSTRTARLCELGELLAEVLEDVRGITHTLSLPDAFRSDLRAALEWAVRKTREGFPGEIDLRGNYRVPANPLQIEQATSIVRDAVENAILHGRALRIRVKVELFHRSCLVEVEDNGVGFDTNRAARPRSGLERMSLRAQIIGGRLSVESSEGAGTTVRCRFPIARPDHVRETVREHSGVEQFTAPHRHRR